MNQRFISVLLFAFAVAAGASLLLYRLLAHRIETKPALPSIQIVMAGRNLDAGTMIKDQDLKTAPWTGPLPAGALTRKEDVLGRGVMAGIVDGEPILESRLAARGAGAGLASMIPPGMRALAVRVNDVAGVGGFVVPGMRVDLLISGNPPNADGHMGSLTKTLLQNIEVLSAGQDFRKDSEGKPISVPVVNLLVTPEQAERLSLAASQTTIQLVLRNPLDTRTTETPGVAMAQLFGNRWQPAPVPRPDRPRPQAAPRTAHAERTPVPPPQPKRDPVVIETIHGGRRAETRFQETAP
jgi:pilus assembly protein CpaB